MQNPPPRLHTVRDALALVLIAALAAPAAAQSVNTPGSGIPPGLTQPEPEREPQADPEPGPEVMPRQAPAPDAVTPPSGPPAPAGKGAAAPATPPNQAKLLDELYIRLASAPDEETAAQVAAAIEQLWQHSGSATADLLVARAVAATEQNRRDLAKKLLDAAVELQPDYAEAWNRRAYLFYLDDDMKRALGDIRRVLALEPQHFKAIEGLANILQGLGEKKAALEAFDSLLKVHPKAPGAKKARDDLAVEIEGQGI